MKKIIVILLVGMLLCTSAFAVQYMSTDKGKTMFTYVATNSTGGYSTTAISTSTIVPGSHRIIGYEIMTLNTTLNAELVVGLYDCSTASAMSSTAIIDESEAEDAKARIKWYPYPVDISTQLSLLQGPNTAVVIYYERK